MGCAMALVMKAAMKAMKATKAMRGLTKDSLIKSKRGKVVSKKASAAGKARYAKSGAKKWADAVKQARKALGVTGFCAIGGKTAQGKALYAKTKALLGQ